MELPSLYYGLILGVVLLFLLGQGLVVYYLETRVRKAPRVQLNHLVSNEKGIHFRISGKDYDLPLEDFSKTGISFSIDTLPSDMVLMRTVTVCFDYAEFTPVEVSAELQYIKTLDDGRIRVGLQFSNPISEHVWNGTMNAAQNTSDYESSKAA